MGWGWGLARHAWRASGRRQRALASPAVRRPSSRCHTCACGAPSGGSSCARRLRALACCSWLNNPAAFRMAGLHRGGSKGVVGRAPRGAGAAAVGTTQRALIPPASLT